MGPGGPCGHGVPGAGDAGSLGEPRVWGHAQGVRESPRAGDGDDKGAQERSQDKRGPVQQGYLEQSYYGQGV